MKKGIVSLIVGIVLLGGAVINVSAAQEFNGRGNGQCVNIENCPKNHENCPNYNVTKTRQGKNYGKNKLNAQRLGGNRQFNCIK